MTHSTVRMFEQLRQIEREASIQIHGEPLSASGIEWLVWIGGSRTEAEPALALTLESLQREGRQASVTFLLDGPQVRGWETVARWLPEFPNRREIALTRRTELPALLYGLALRRSRAAWAAFLWPGCRAAAGTIETLKHGSDGADLVYAGFSTAAHPFEHRPAAGWALKDAPGWHDPAEVLHPVQYGWLQMVDCIPMNGCLLSVAFARAVEPFDANPLLGPYFWWHATRRISAAGKIAFVPAELPPARWSWDAFPFQTKAEVSADLATRLLSWPSQTRAGQPSPQAAAAEIEGFQNDLLAEESLSLTLALSAWSEHESAAELPQRTAREAPFPIRVTVLGGPYEPHHNQLYFFNFFDQAAGRGYVSWKTLLYQTCRPEDLERSDLVVFCRPRYAECEVLLEACRRRGIPTLTMIDDNWIVAGREFPQYEGLFLPGKPAYETFVRCLAGTDATLVFNEDLEEDIRPLARRVHRLPPNVDTTLFRADPALARERPAGFLAGYAGSPRPERAAFRALAELARRHDDVRLLAMAHERPPEWDGLPAERLLFVPFRANYGRYARGLASLRPDVLVAPLDGSRFSASKCPTKYLELSAAGTAGVYSQTKPYTQYVAPGRTGLLVENTEEAWLGGLEALHADPARRAGIARAAREDVLARFDTARVLPALLELLGKTAAARRPSPVPPAAPRT